MSVILAKLLEVSGLTQSELARRVGTSQSQIFKLLNGERELTRSWADRIAPHLGVQSVDLLYPELTGILADMRPEAVELRQLTPYLEAEDFAAIGGLVRRLAAARLHGRVPGPPGEETPRALPAPQRPKRPRRPKKP